MLIRDYFHALGVVFPTRRRWTLGSALFQADFLRAPHPMDDEFPLGSAIPAPERSREALSSGNFGSRCSFLVGNFPAPASSSGARIW